MNQCVPPFSSHLSPGGNRRRGCVSQEASTTLADGLAREFLVQFYMSDVAEDRTHDLPQSRQTLYHYPIEAKKKVFFKQFSEHQICMEL